MMSRTRAGSARLRQQAENLRIIDPIRPVRVQILPDFRRNDALPDPVLTCHDRHYVNSILPAARLRESAVLSPPDQVAEPKQWIPIPHLEAIHNCHLEHPPGQTHQNSPLAFNAKGATGARKTQTPPSSPTGDRTAWPVRTGRSPTTPAGHPRQPIFLRAPGCPRYIDVAGCRPGKDSVMALINFDCPECGHNLEVDEGGAGSR